MNDDKEIVALLSLIEDPDSEVFEAVSNRIVDYGTPIITHLEHLSENTVDTHIHDRVEWLIHHIHFTHLKSDFRQWNEAPHHELLLGALLVAKLIYPDLHIAKTIQDVERLRRDTWLELNQYLTPLEQVQIVSNILYNYFGLKPLRNPHPQPNDFLISKVIENKKGNQSGNGTLYLLLAELLDIPIRLILLPEQFVLAYFKSSAISETEKLHLNIDFFIDPTTGQIFTHNDLYNYFYKQAVPIKPQYFEPQTNKQVIEKLLIGLICCFGIGNKPYMVADISELIAILKD